MDVYQNLDFLSFKSLQRETNTSYREFWCVLGVCVCVVNLCVCTPLMYLLRSEDNCVELVLSSHLYTGFRDGTQVGRLV